MGNIKFHSDIYADSFMVKQSDGSYLDIPTTLYGKEDGFVTLTTKTLTECLEGGVISDVTAGSLISLLNAGKKIYAFGTILTFLSKNTTMYRRSVVFTFDGYTLSVAENNSNKIVVSAIPDNLTTEYSASSTYTVGDYCKYNETFYKCTTAIETPEDFNIEHWSVVTNVLSEVAGKVDKEDGKSLVKSTSLDSEGRVVSFGDNDVVYNSSGDLEFRKKISAASGITTSTLNVGGNDVTEDHKKITELSLLCNHLVPITYAELKALRDASNLVVGRWYRITDYQCTTMQEDTQSAEHQFDVIVLATEVNKLNENAFACLHEGDTYFSGANAKLDAWQLKYCLDNDTARFAWADTTNGKGVIFWMKDEWNNECPYDFKNIQFKRYKITACNWNEDLVGKYGITENDGKYTVDEDNPYWCYTFCMLDFYDNKAHDLSVEQDKYMSDEGFCYKTHDNIFKSAYQSDYDEESDTNTPYRFYLSNNVMVTDTDICYVEEDYSYGEFYGFESNTFGNNCYRNTFGNDCYNNTFGNNCYRNTFGNDCYNNTFGNYFQQNTFGNDCGSNTFGNGCYNNTFGNDCYNNTFGNNCYRNTFGNDCGSNTFGNNFQQNTFGNNFRNNTFGNYFQQNTFGNYMQWCTFEDGVQYITTSCTTGSSAYLQNMHVLNGTQGTSSSSLLTITITANRKYCTFVGKNSSGTLKIWCPADTAS